MEKPSWIFDGFRNPAGHVVGLDFGRMNLRGTISPSIAGLTHLRDFAINNNLIRGTIPTQIGSLKELEMLLLYKNNLVAKYLTCPRHV